MKRELREQQYDDVFTNLTIGAVGIIIATVMVVSLSLQTPPTEEVTILPPVSSEKYNMGEEMMFRMKADSIDSVMRHWYTVVDTNSNGTPDYLDTIQ